MNQRGHLNHSLTNPLVNLSEKLYLSHSLNKPRTQMPAGKKLYDILLKLTPQERRIIKSKLENYKELSQEEHFLLYVLKYFKPDIKELEQLERQYAHRERLLASRMRQLRSRASNILLTMLINLCAEEHVIIKSLLNMAIAVEMRRRKLYPRAIEINKKLLDDPVVPFYSPELRLLAFSELQKISRVDTRYAPSLNGQLEIIKEFSEELSHLLDYLRISSQYSYLREWERTTELPLKASDIPEEVVETYEMFESLSPQSVSDRPPFVFRIYALSAGVLYRICLHFNTAFNWLSELKAIYNDLLKNTENRQRLADQYLHDMIHLCANAIGLGFKDNITLIEQIEQDLKKFQNFISPERYQSYQATLFSFKTIAMFKQGKVEDIIRLFSKPADRYKKILANQDKHPILKNAQIVYLMSLAAKGKTAQAIKNAQEILNNLKTKNYEITISLLIIITYASLLSGHSVSAYVGKMAKYIKSHFGELKIMPALEKLLVAIGKRNYEDARKFFNELKMALDKNPLETNVFRQIPFMQIIYSIIYHEDLQKVLQSTDFHTEALHLEERTRKYLHKELLISTF